MRTALILADVIANDFVFLSVDHFLTRDNVNKHSASCFRITVSTWIFGKVRFSK